MNNIFLKCKIIAKEILTIFQVLEKGEFHYGVCEMESDGRRKPKFYILNQDINDSC